MKHQPFILLLLLVSGMFSCSDSDTWTTDRSVQLSFSRDTVAFDTLISTVPSSTEKFVIYNRNKDGVRIQRASLAAGASSIFRVNVDGQDLHEGEGTDFELPRRDSLIVCVEVTPPETGKDTPVGYEDDLQFQLESGVVQRVHLTVGAQDAFILRGMVVCADTTFSNRKPIVIHDSLVVAADATLTLPEGTTLMFHDGAGMDVHGRVVATGTLENPVTLRGDRTDHMFDYLPYDNTPSRWEGIHLYSTSKENVFSYCDIHSACYGIVCDSTEIDTHTLLMENCIIHNIGGDGLRLDNVQSQFINTQISNTLGRCVYVYGGACRFVHCTIAQFYPFDASRGYALSLSNEENEVYRHLYYAYFQNCVITGYGDDVIIGSISEGQDYTCDYLFENCFLNTVVSDDTLRFRHIVYDTDDDSPDHTVLVKEKNFVLFDTRNFLYDFTPDSLSRIRNMASGEFLEQMPTDRLGRSRLEDEGPDVGCYEYVKP